MREGAVRICSVCRDHVRWHRSGEWRDRRKSPWCYQLPMKHEPELTQEKLV